VLATSVGPKIALAINHCHLAHQVFFWSDVTNGWGDQISPSMLQPPINTPHSSWKWPVERPSKADWRIWSTFLRNSPYTATYCLLNPLGPWLYPTHCLDFLPFNPARHLAFHQVTGRTGGLHPRLPAAVLHYPCVPILTDDCPPST